jgi:hypothetical protein
MFNSTYNDYFGRSKSYFNKYYIDYCLKEISKTKKFTENEAQIIKKGKYKYYTLIGINFLIFIYTSKRIYTKGILELYSGQWAFNIRDGFLFSVLFSLGAMVYLYKEAHRLYYNDVKYIIKKYKYIDQQQFLDAEINLKIAERFKGKLEQIERGI